MKINFLYDILGPTKPFPNGYTSLYSIDNFWYVDSLNSIIGENLSIDDYLSTDKTQIYFYPISTSGDYYKSLGISHKRNQSIFSKISKKAISVINDTENVYAFFEHTGEPDFDSDILKKIYDDCKDIKLNIEKVLIVNGVNSNNIILEDFREKYGCYEKIKLLTYNWPIPFKSLELRGALGIEKNKDSETSTIADISHIKSKKVKKALFLNRRLRYHRLLSLCFLAENDTLNDILYSFDIKQNMFDNIEHMIKNDEIQHNPIYITNYVDKSKILSGYKKLLKIEKNTLDKDELSTVHGYGMESRELYEQTFFSIVSETTFSKFTQSFTEKILKPIQHHHPFILIGSPYTLKVLKKYGFKTFNKWWDESYDNIENDEQRLLSVMKIINRLINISASDWYRMLEEMEDILIHNHKLLLSFDDTKIEPLLLKNIQEIIKNNSNYIL